jgi:chromosome partitioning protein
MGLSGILPRPRKRTSTSKGATLGQVIAFANQKGGVAKTTTTLNLAVAFKEHGFDVLAVDLDPQGNLTMSQGMDPDQVERSMYDVLVHSMPVEDVIHRAEVDVAVSSIDLAGAELALSSMIGRERALQKALLPVRNRYDYILIDTPPSLGLLTINALTASDGVIVPVQCEYLSLRGLVQLENTLSMIRENLNPVVEIKGILPTMYDSRTVHSRAGLPRPREGGAQWRDAARACVRAPSPSYSRQPRPRSVRLSVSARVRKQPKRRPSSTPRRRPLPPSPSGSATSRPAPQILQPSSPLRRPRMDRFPSPSRYPCLRSSVTTSPPRQPTLRTLSRGSTARRDPSRPPTLP